MTMNLMLLIPAWSIRMLAALFFCVGKYLLLTLLCAVLVILLLELAEFRASTAQIA